MRVVMSDALLRLAVQDDLPSIMKIQEKAYGSALLEPMEMFEKIISISPETCFVAEYNKEIVAYFLTHPIPDQFSAFGKEMPHLTGYETTIYIHDLCVAPDCQGMGIANCLFKFFLDRLSGKKHKAILGVAVQNSESFWVRQRFNVEEEYTYPGGSEGYVIRRSL